MDAVSVDADVQNIDNICLLYTSESSQDFVTAYRDAYGIDPLQFAADAYDGVYAIKAAAEKAEITPDMSTSDICDALKTAMTEIQIDGLTGTEMHWTAAVSYTHLDVYKRQGLGWYYDSGQYFPYDSYYRGNDWRNDRVWIELQIAV